jgi:hypothetical protein
MSDEIKDEDLIKIAQTAKIKVQPKVLDVGPHTIGFIEKVGFDIGPRQVNAKSVYGAFEVYTKSLGFQVPPKHSFYKYFGSRFQLYRNGNLNYYMLNMKITEIVDKVHELRKQHEKENSKT